MKTLKFLIGKTPSTETGQEVDPHILLSFLQMVDEDAPPVAPLPSLGQVEASTD